MAKQSLMERTVENRVEASEESEFIDCIRVDGASVEYRTMEGSSWSDLIQLSELVDTDVGETVGENQVLSENVRRTLKELRTKVRQQWNDELEMYRLNRVTDDDGDLVELNLPFDTEMTEDITVVRLYDENGDFNAEDVEEQMDEEPYRLWELGLFVDEINENADVHTRKQKRSTLHECMDDSFSQAEQMPDSVGEGLAKTVLSAILVSLYGVLIFTALGEFVWLGVLLMVLTTAMIFPSLLRPFTWLVSGLLTTTSGVVSYILRLRRTESRLLFEN